MARKIKGETLITIKTVRVEGEITAYGSKSILHRKLTCYTGPNGVLYYADDRNPCTRGTMGIVWKTFKKLPRFAHSEKEITLPLKDVVSVLEKRLRGDVKNIGDVRQKRMAELYNQEIRAVIREVKKIV